MATSNTSVQREILAQAAHDLRSPLNTIVFAAEALADFARDSPNAHLAVERIQRAVEYMTGIIQDVLVDGTSASSAIHCERFEPEEAIVSAVTVGTVWGSPSRKRLVSAHGGRVWVDSNAGRGSTFYAALPLTRTSPTNQRGAA